LSDNFTYFTNACISAKGSGGESTVYIQGGPPVGINAPLWMFYILCVSNKLPLFYILNSSAKMNGL